ncbi:CAP domain-containing protein [Sphingomonas sp. LT1P40]|uniref:CAP domain-containing protein n=1 Tax=Alteristakelama amylovorans TaxID=3096166 RepID=UPI002FCBF658
MRLLAIPCLLAVVAQPSAASPRLEREILEEINRARSNPAAYADRLRIYRGYFRGKVVRYPGNPNGLRTAEGTAAVDEAIAALRRQQPRTLVKPATLLAHAARDHVAEQGPRGVTGHESANGDRAPKRVVRRGGGNYVAEVITYGPPSAVEVVRQLIVDDDVPGRGHRITVYAAEWAFAGAACGPHKRYGTMCVVNFARTPTGIP